MAEARDNISGAEREASGAPVGRGLSHLMLPRRSLRTGLPLSVQLIGPAGQDESLLRYAAALAELYPPVGVPPGCL